jgi:hypothetical protein
MVIHLMTEFSKCDLNKLDLLLIASCLDLQSDLMFCPTLRNPVVVSERRLQTKILVSVLLQVTWTTTLQDRMHGI